MQFFPDGFRDINYLAWEREYKWKAHLAWRQALGAREFQRLLCKQEYSEIALRAVRVEGHTNLLFSFEKMALRDAIRSAAGSRHFALGLYDLLYGPGSEASRFGRWCDTVSRIPRRLTRVFTWPVVTVFGFLALPRTHIFLKPNVTRLAARAYGFNFHYHARPNWDTYASLLDFAHAVRVDQKALDPRDMIDIQSFLWVQGSPDYDSEQRAADALI
jgi:hypothetical protein